MWPIPKSNAAKADRPPALRFSSLPRVHVEPGMFILHGGAVSRSPSQCIVFPRTLPRIFFLFLIVYKIILHLKIVGFLYLIKVVSVTVIICDTLNDPAC